LRALLFTLRQAWPGIGRLPKALKSAGFRVAVAAYEDSFVIKSRFIDERYVLPKLVFSLRAFLRTVERWEPDIVIPGDEPAAQLLRFVVSGLEARRPGFAPSSVLGAIDFSLGAKPFRHLWGNRQKVQELAASLGIRVPPSASVDSDSDAFAFVERHGYPAVLKNDNTHGGDRVVICADETMLRDALRRSAEEEGKGESRRVRLRRLLWRALHGFVDGKGRSIHGFVAGQPANRCFVALAGEPWGGLSARAERTHPEPTGPGTVVRLCENAEMAAAAERFARHVGYTGIGGLDFVLSRDDGHAYLIEFNPRPTPIFHLGALVGIDLAGAFYRALAEGGRPPTQALTAERVVALFPQEWYRDLESAFLKESPIDVPFDDAPLLAAYVAGHPYFRAAS